MGMVVEVDLISIVGEDECCRTSALSIQIIQPDIVSSAPDPMVLSSATPSRINSPIVLHILTCEDICQYSIVFF